MSGARLRRSRLMAANDNKDFASLKGLLFSDETEQLAALQARLVALDGRVGDDALLTKSVANIVAQALRQAEVVGHRELSQAISPLVVASIRREIVDSREVMVEALYPITGRLVSSYVSGAIQKLSDDINARFDALLSPRSLALRMRAALSGKSYGELVLAQNGRFQVSQILLVAAHSGVCIARWPQDAAGKADDKNVPHIGSSNVDMISALLTAIMDFSREAFAGESSELRSLNFGNMLLLLRRSPQYIVAAVGKGQVTPNFEARVDEEFLNILDALGKSGVHPAPLLEQLHEKLETIPAVAVKRAGGVSPALVLFSVIGLALAAWIGWSMWRGSEARRLAAQITAVEHLPELQGYPVSVQAGDTLRVTGIAPNSAARDLVVNKLAEIFPKQEISMQVGLVASSQDVINIAKSSAEIAQKADALDSALKNLTVEHAKTNMQIAALEDLNLQNLTTLRGALSAKVDSQVQDVAAQNAKVETQVQDVAEKLQDSVKTTAQVLAQKQAAFEAVVTGLRDLSEHLKQVEAKLESPELKLHDWVAQHAIYFGDGSNYRDDAIASRTLDDLVALMKAVPDQKLRLAGYSDEPALAPQANKLASLKRAQKVAQGMIERGIAPDRLIVVSRGAAQKISESEGSGSANRRVTFELAAAGE